jgi:UPF0716 protein FxsA
MFLRLLALFTLVPLIELFLLIEIGRRIGFPATIGLVLGTGVLGAWLARREGLKTLQRVQAEWREGRVPTQALVDGILILIAGAVLLTPGLLTDLAGFFLLLPFGRRVVGRAAVDFFRRRSERLQRPLGGRGGEPQPNVIIIEPREKGNPPNPPFSKGGH